MTSGPSAGANLPSTPPLAARRADDTTSRSPSRTSAGSGPSPKARRESSGPFRLIDGRVDDPAGELAAGVAERLEIGGVGRIAIDHVNPFVVVVRRSGG